MDKASSCDGKFKYLTQEEAEKARVQMIKRHHKKFDKYLCPWCKNWHIGSSKLIKDSR